MKKIILVFAILSSLISEAQTRVPNMPQATTLSDTDYVVINKSDSNITKIIRAKYTRAGAIKDVSPASGDTIKAVTTAGFSVLVFHASGTLSTLKIQLPQSPINGQPFTITGDQTVTTLTIYGGTTVTTYPQYAVASVIHFIYDTANSKWYNR